MAAVITALGWTWMLPAEATTAPSQWSQPGYGAGHTFYNPQESIVNAGTIKKAKLRWSFTRQAGTPGCNASPQGPLVVDGRVFVLDSDGVAALDAKTGKRLWNDTSFSFISANLIVVDGLLLVTDTSCYSNSNYDGTVTALDVKTGAQRWSSGGSWMVDTIVADAGMIVTSGYCGTCDDFEHGVIGIRASDGAEVWSHENMVLAGPVSAGGRVLLRGTTEWLPDFVASIKTGVSLYSPGSGWTPSAASPAGDRFYATNGAGLSAIDAKSGKIIWTVKKEAGDLATDRDRIYVASAGRVNTYHPKSGKLLWTRPVTDPERLVRAGGLLYVTSGAGALSILSPPTGKPTAPGNAFSPTYGVVVAGGRIYAGNGDTVRTYAP
jgi:outer membrane protein assembly factor BamB